MKFCSQCGNPVTRMIPAGDNRMRHVCGHCATVHYEARCPGTPQGAGVQGTQHNYIGGSCMGVGDAITIPGSPLACPVEQVIVRVTDVTGCL